MVFDYFYEEQSESYSFYRIPKMLFTEEIFEALSTDAKVLYGLLLDRISLSRENGWMDDAGRVYVYYTIKSVKKSMRCANTKACGLLRELDEFGLIERKKQGLGKPTIIYVKDFTRFRKAELLDSDKQNSVILYTGTLDNRKSERNKTEKNNTESNKTNPILSGADKDMDERTSYRNYLNSQLDMEIMYERYPYDRETLDAIMDIKSVNMREKEEHRMFICFIRNSDLRMQIQVIQSQKVVVSVEIFIFILLECHLYLKKILSKQNQV